MKRTIIAIAFVIAFLLGFGCSQVFKGATANELPVEAHIPDAQDLVWNVVF